MKVEIEVSEINAALLWADNWRQTEPGLVKLIQSMVEAHGAGIQRTFPMNREQEQCLIGAFYKAFPGLVKTANAERSGDAPTLDQLHAMLTSNNIQETS